MKKRPCHCRYFTIACTLHFSLSLSSHVSTNLCPLWLFLLSYVAVLRPCLLLELFPNRDLLKRVKARMWFKCFSHSHARNFSVTMKQLSDFNIDKCYKGEDVTENHTRFTVTVTCGSGISLCFDYFNVFDLVRVSPILPCKRLHKKSCRSVLYSCYLIFSFGMPIIFQTLLERFLQELTVNSDDSIYYK